MIAAIYARKSTEQHGMADDQKSITRQIDGARRFIAEKGWTLDEGHIYCDDGVSGALFANRAEFQRMLKDAKADAFNAVVFFDLDRFGRHAHHTMVALNALADLGVDVWDFSTGVRVNLDTFEGRISTTLQAEFAQQYRDQIRKHTSTAMRRKAEAGHVTGGRVFGYDNLRVAKGQTDRVPNAAEAAIVRDIYARSAAGEGTRTIAAALNRAKSPSPRSQQGRPNGWSHSTIRAVLERTIYRGEVVYGRTKKAYGRELGKRSTREKGQIDAPEASWIRVDAPQLRIIDVDLAARVDARRKDRRTRYLTSLEDGGHVPERAHGKYLLSGGLLICPTCNGHFEALKSPWKDSGVYVCATRRRKPGVCSNSLSLPMADTDETVLTMIEDEVLDAGFIEELLALVDRGDEDDSARLTADAKRLRGEVDRLVESIAAGVPAGTVAPAIAEREAELARIDVQQRTHKRPRPNIDKLRAALTERSEGWRADLRGEPQVARLVLRKLITPLVLHDPDTPSKEWVEWEASVTPAMLDGLYNMVASPTGFGTGWTHALAHTTVQGVAERAA